MGIKFDEINLDKDNAADKLLKDMETNLDNQIDSHEFIKAIEKWLNEVLRGNRCGDPGSESAKLISDFYEVRLHNITLHLGPGWLIAITL